MKIQTFGVFTNLCFPNLYLHVNSNKNVKDIRLMTYRIRRILGSNLVADIDYLY